MQQELSSKFQLKKVNSRAESITLKLNVNLLKCSLVLGRQYCAGGIKRGGVNCIPPYKHVDQNESS